MALYPPYQSILDNASGESDGSPWLPIGDGTFPFRFENYFQYLNFWPQWADEEGFVYGSPYTFKTVGGPSRTWVARLPLTGTGPVRMKLGPGFYPFLTTNISNGYSPPDTLSWSMIVTGTIVDVDGARVELEYVREQADNESAVTHYAEQRVYDVDGILTDTTVIPDTAWDVERTLYPDAFGLGDLAEVAVTMTVNLSYTGEDALVSVSDFGVQYALLRGSFVPDPDPEPFVPPVFVGQFWPRSRTWPPPAPEVEE